MCESHLAEPLYAQGGVAFFVLVPWTCEFVNNPEEVIYRPERFSTIALVVRPGRGQDQFPEEDERR